MKISIPTADIKAAFSSVVQSAIADETSLVDDAKSQVTVLVEALYPLVIAETQSLITRDPAIGQTYLKILAATVELKIAELGLLALATQKQQIGKAFALGAQILGMVIKGAIVAAL